MAAPICSFGGFSTRHCSTGDEVSVNKASFTASTETSTPRINVCDRKNNQTMDCENSQSLEDPPAASIPVVSASKSSLKIKPKKMKKKASAALTSSDEPPSPQQGVLGLQRLDDATKSVISIQGGHFLGRLPTKFLRLLSTSVTPVLSFPKPSLNGEDAAKLLCKKGRQRRKELEKLRRLYPVHLGIPADDTCISRKCLQVMSVSSTHIVLKRVQQDFEGHDSLPVKVLRVNQEQQYHHQHHTYKKATDCLSMTNDSNRATILTQSVLPNDTVTLRQGDTLMIMGEKHKFRVVSPHEISTDKSEVDNQKATESDSPVEERKSCKKTGVVTFDLGAAVAVNPPVSSINAVATRIARTVDRKKIKKRLTRDGCLLPRKGSLKMLEDGAFAEPCGRKPFGLVWDRVRGLWAPPTQTETGMTLSGTEIPHNSNPKKQTTSSKQSFFRYPKRTRNDENYKEATDIEEEMLSPAPKKLRLFTVEELERQFEMQLKQEVQRKLASVSKPKGPPNPAAARPREVSIKGKESFSRFKTSQQYARHGQNQRRERISRQIIGTMKHGPWWNMVARGIKSFARNGDRVSTSSALPGDNWGCLLTRIDTRCQVRIAMSQAFPSRRYVGEFSSFVEAQSALEMTKLYRKGDVQAITKLTGAKKLRICSADVCFATVALCDTETSEIHFDEDEYASDLPSKPGPFGATLSTLHLYGSGILLGTTAWGDDAASESLQSEDLETEDCELEDSDVEEDCYLDQQDISCVLTYAPEVKEDLFPSKDGCDEYTADQEHDSRNKNDSSPGKSSGLMREWESAVLDTVSFLATPKGRESCLQEDQRDSSLLKCVTQRPSGKWQAQIYFAGKSRYIGVFDDRETAATASKLVRERLKRGVLSVLRRKPNVPDGVEANDKKQHLHFMDTSTDHIQHNERRQSRRSMDPPLAQTQSNWKSAHSFDKKWPAKVKQRSYDVVRSRQPKKSKRYYDDPKTQMILEASMHVHYCTMSLLDL